jgi:AraC-like DNA-binding protein
MRCFLKIKNGERNHNGIECHIYAKGLQALELFLSESDHQKPLIDQSKFKYLSSPMNSFHHYLPISDDLFHDGFYVTGAGRTRIVPGVIYPPKPHPAFYRFTWDEGRIFPEFSVILITRGKGIFESRETGRCLIEPGHVILLFPGIWHRYRPDLRVGWTEKWIQFNGEFVHKLWDRGLLSPKRQVLKMRHFREMESAMEAILAQIEQHPGSNSLQYSLRVSRVLDLVIDAQPKPLLSVTAGGISATQDELMTVAQNYIWTHSQLALSVGDIAAHLGIGRRTLERKFSATIGRTVLQEIARCRFNRAKRLLQETGLPIKTVVHLAGFGRAENMRQEFMKQSRLSPGAYRAQFGQRTSAIDALTSRPSAAR